MQFDTDKGASRSTWIATGLVIAIVGWMGSGFVIPSANPEAPVSREEPKPVSVAVSTSVAKTITQFYQAEGQARPDRDTMMRAATSGDVADVLVTKGQDVKAGDVIAQLDPTGNIADANRAAEAAERAVSSCVAAPYSSLGYRVNADAMNAGAEGHTVDLNNRLGG